MMWERLSAAEVRAHMALDAAARALAAELLVARNASAAACVRQRDEAEAQVCRMRQADAPSQHKLEGGSTRPPPSCENGSGCSSRASAPQRKLKSAGCAGNARSLRRRGSACARADLRSGAAHSGSRIGKARARAAESGSRGGGARAA